MFTFYVIFTHSSAFGLKFEGSGVQATIAKKFGGHAHIKIWFLESPKIDLEAGI